MKTSSQTTYILLESGLEDRLLLAEINKIIADLKIKSIKIFIEHFPMLSELRYGLEIECGVRE